jgi:hypothetical protein
MQGVLCGDCLFMRYGENILEVAEKDEWTCPVCRGLCNCSNHRIRRGWAPTGSLYRRAIAEGTHCFCSYACSRCHHQQMKHWLVCIATNFKAACNRLASKAGWLFDVVSNSICCRLVAKAKCYFTAVSLMLLWLAGYRSVAHYLVLTQQASDATATKQEVNQEAATCTAEPGTAAQPPVLKSNNAETSGKIAHMQVYLLQSVYPLLNQAAISS